MIDVTGRVVAGERNEVILSVVVRAADRGSRRQCLCTEMIHWDDYRAMRAVNDGAPPMASIFSSQTQDGDAAGSGVTTFVQKEHTYDTVKIVAASPELAGSSRQTVCTEMIHWDDLRQARGLMAPNEIPIAVQMRPPKEAKTFQLYEPSSGTVITTTTRNVAIVKGGNTMSYSAEMEHFDDYCQQHGIPQQTAMRKMFASS